VGFQVALELDRHIVRVDALDVDVQTDIAGPNAGVSLAGESGGDFLLRHRGVEVAHVVAGPDHGEFDVLELLDELLALLALGGEQALGLGALGGDGGDGFIAGRGGHIAGKEEVAGKAQADVDDITDDADGIDVLGEHELDGFGHGSLSLAPTGEWGRVRSRGHG
jgi:hypothetical protein